MTQKKPKKEKFIFCNQNLKYKHIICSKGKHQTTKQKKKTKIVTIKLVNMVLSILNKAIVLNRGPIANHSLKLVRFKTHSRHGSVLPMPKVIPFGFFGIILSVIPGLFVGAAISKSVANFLEENDLFVPSDDDDDED